ncbi:family 16 glycosylhydrolase [Aquimarina pacifica]|uniref:family 16 glycosylhydrolase n=1 Tax=Aquimarina pacifica TaxID=1296415 RepID=UPI0004700FB3|nr:family 16 glycosylhydrolase [Aquimarina pacifica]
MKNSKLTFILASILSLTILFVSCEDENRAFGDITAPTNIEITAEVMGVDESNPNGDGSGFVKFTAKSDNAITYGFEFGDGLNEVAPSGETIHRFSQPGLNTYTVVVTVSGVAGISTNKAIDVEVFSSFDDPISKSMLTGAVYDDASGMFTENKSKTWYWSASEPGHLGLGPATEGIDGDWWYAKWYVAQPFEKESLLDPESTENSQCIYTDALTFSMVDGELMYELNSNGGTYFNVAYVDVAGGSASEDYCYDYPVSGAKTVAVSPASSGVPLEETTDTALNFSDDGFMGYYIGASTYEILSITENRMVVRAIQGNNAVLAWYHIFTTQKPVQSLDFESQYTQEVWADEFDVDGAPDPLKWNYNLGNNGGWGNEEVQFYTDEADNVLVEDGYLKITAINDGGDYTSARIKTEDLFEFTYGRVEVRAKLPEGGGTWPAIWMLGEDYATNIWPACGEIDIMEHVGNNQDVVHSSLHYTNFSAGNAITKSTTVDGASDDFHNYTVDWSPEQIVFLVDDVVYHTIPNTNELPFNDDFFIILNVAMGGKFGGVIDAGFIESTMEVDYVRVYQ